MAFTQAQLLKVLATLPLPAPFTTTVATAAAVGATTLMLASTTSIAAGQAISIGAALDAKCKVTAIDSTTETVTLSSPALEAISAGAPVTVSGLSWASGLTGALAATQQIGPLDTTGDAVRAFLFSRVPASGGPSSLERVVAVASGAAVVTTPPPNYTAAQVAVLAGIFDDMLKRSASFTTSQAAILQLLQIRMGVFSAAKLADGFGVLWAAGEIGVSTDPGDAVAVVNTLVTPTVAVLVPAPSLADIQGAMSA